MRVRRKKRTGKSADGKSTDEEPDEKADAKPDSREPLLYTVELHFIEPNPEAKPGDRTFDVSIQGKKLLERFDIAREAEGPNRGIVRRFEGIAVPRELRIEFKPISGKPVLSGISVEAE